MRFSYVQLILSYFFNFCKMWQFPVSEWVCWYNITRWDQRKNVKITNVSY